MKSGKLIWGLALVACLLFFGYGILSGEFAETIKRCNEQDRAELWWMEAQAYYDSTILPGWIEEPAEYESTWMQGQAHYDSCLIKSEAE